MADRLSERPASLISSPDLLPVQLDSGCERIRFIPMSRESYRASAFLDSRAMRVAGNSQVVGVRELLAAYRGNSGAGYAHYIMHGAFCCSTLLTRYLDLVASLFVLREPDILRQILLLDRQAAPDQLRCELLELAARLLARTYRDDETAIVKCNDLCNYLADDLLRVDPRSKLIFVRSGLRVFLLAILKSNVRRQWARNRVLTILGRAREPALLTKEIDAGSLSDGQSAAFLWLCYRRVCRDLQRNFKGRVCVLDGDRIATNPRAVLHRVSNFFNIELPDGSIAEVLRRAPSSRHAKYLFMPFDAQRRFRERVDAEARFGAEATAAEQWAMELYLNSSSRRSW